MKTNHMLNNLSLKTKHMKCFFQMVNSISVEPNHKLQSYVINSDHIRKVFTVILMMVLLQRRVRYHQTYFSLTHRWAQV